ncbi:hemicentin-1-like isoform X2 [Alosa sapidissima]|uniref:hemicentin-1-like isoform X2 n=1 Tax=Alosa sapidissima TaxID=34773 RepID=UPI001C0869A3|nr:hemicentin-1-like isoform X2 [Alosa sapidissima]
MCMCWMACFLYENVFGEHWKVAYKPESACVFVGSPVNMSCSFTHPSSVTIKEIYWTKEKYQDPPDLTGDPNYRDRVIVHRQQGTKICNLQIKPVNMLDSDSRYYCSSIFNESQKWTGDPGVHLQVKESPEKPPVSISPHGDILEGIDVTLTCSSRSDLQVRSYSWFKRNPVQFLGTGHTYTFKQIRPEDSGEYTCKSSYECGDRYSTMVYLHVFYPPKNTTMLADQPFVIAKGNRTTLTCSSVANPPVESYTWFKMDESTPVGSGQQYSITNIRSEDGGQYYCVARNKYGAENSTAVSITVEGMGASPGLRDRSSALPAVVAVFICGHVALVCVVVWVRIMKRRQKPEDQDLQYSSVNVQNRRGAEDDGQYCNINLQRSGQSRVDVAAGGAEDDGHYSTVQPHGSRQTAGAQGDDVQYASVQFKKAMAADRTPVQPEGEPSPIYSCVQGSQDPSVVYSGVQPSNGGTPH